MGPKGGVTQITFLVNNVTAGILGNIAEFKSHTFKK